MDPFLFSFAIRLNSQRPIPPRTQTLICITPPQTLTPILYFWTLLYRLESLQNCRRSGCSARMDPFLTSVFTLSFKCAPSRTTFHLTPFFFHVPVQTGISSKLQKKWLLDKAPSIRVFPRVRVRVRVGPISRLLCTNQLSIWVNPGAELRVNPRSRTLPELKHQSCFTHLHRLESLRSCRRSGCSTRRRRSCEILLRKRSCAWTPLRSR